MMVLLSAKFHTSAEGIFSGTTNIYCRPLPFFTFGVPSRKTHDICEGNNNPSPWFSTAVAIRMKQFDIPSGYLSPVIGRIKHLRKDSDPRKKDFSPTLLDFGPVRFLIARHFGFCYGVENAIEIAYKAVAENPGRKIYLLSEMIHNPEVNRDLQAQGITFIMDTHGTQLVPWDSITKEDVVIIPAFGTTLEIMEIIGREGIEPITYDTTCPFVQKVWKRAEQLGGEEYSIVVHGKHKHEETRATFSHSQKNAPTVVVRDMEDTEKLAAIIEGRVPMEQFEKEFAGKFSEGFQPELHLQRLGVVNQTTMLASETQAIADRIKQAIVLRYGEQNWTDHFADTRDTLCYATYDNQRATMGLLEHEADFAIVVGGYNSSNTSHIVDLCAEKFKTYFISSADCIGSAQEIRHFDYHKKLDLHTVDFLVTAEPTTIVLTSGASCPDTLVDAVMMKLVSFFPGSFDVEHVISSLSPK
jgi:4-hydroxy-3-methylbut-2-enyl diphosphate reductase